MGGDHASTHVGVDVLEGPNAMVIIAQKDLGMEGDVSFDTVRVAFAALRRTYAELLHNQSAVSAREVLLRDTTARSSSRNAQASIVSGVSSSR